jgi:hypothetical protein
MRTWLAIIVVAAGLPSRSLRGRRDIVIIRSRVAIANTIPARGAGEFAVGVEHAGKGRS